MWVVFHKTKVSLYSQVYYIDGHLLSTFGPQVRDRCQFYGHLLLYKATICKRRAPVDQKNFLHFTSCSEDRKENLCETASAEGGLRKWDQPKMTTVAVLYRFDCSSEVNILKRWSFLNLNLIFFLALLKHNKHLFACKVPFYTVEIHFIFAVFSET